MAGLVYEFEWDPEKAKLNFAKHGIAFEQVSEVFRDPLAVTIADDEHSADEIRWITLGRDTAGQLVLAVHTFKEVDPGLVRIRLISARRPTPAEIRAYEEP
jgi:hypothetical protein